MYHYYDETGERVGPVRGSQLLSLAAQGKITPETKVELSDGTSRPARKIQGIVFSTPPPPLPPPIVPDIAVHLEESVPSLTVPKPTPLPSSRAIFIFLAVFVGIFGVHDFYAKRVNHGWIHLALLSPWILAFLLTILGVFGYTLYTVCYSPYRKEIRECQRDIASNQKSIKDVEQQIGKLRLKLGAALRGQKDPEPIPQSGATPIPQSGPEPIPQSGTTPIPQSGPKPIEVDIDHKLVQELERALANLESELRRLKWEQDALQGTLSDLYARNSADKLRAVGLSLYTLWLYFFFYVLPVASWVMAMCEIVYITKDGSGNEFGF